MDKELRQAERSGNTLKVLRLLQRSDKLSIHEIFKVGGTPQHLKELGFEFPQNSSDLILAKLYNHSRTQGFAAQFAKMDHIMTEEEASIIIMLSGYRFDYLYGRVMKIDLLAIDHMLYDRDNGPGALDLAMKCHGCERCSG